MYTNKRLLPPDDMTPEIYYRPLYTTFNLFIKTRFPLKQEYPYKEDIKSIKKSDDIKLSGYGAAKAILFKKRHGDPSVNKISSSSSSHSFTTPIKVEEDALSKAKKALEDYSAAYELVSKGPFCIPDEDTLASMKRSVQIQAKHYFSLVQAEQKKLLPHLFPNDTPSDIGNMNDTQSSINYSSPD